MADTKNVTNGKPKIGGAIYRAAMGSALPTDATTELDKAFKNLGYCSEDGLTNKNTSSSDSKKAWGGDTVLTYQKEREDTFEFTLIEILNIDVLKAIFGDENVKGELKTGITINANGNEQEEACWVIEMILRDGALKRIVIPDGKISEMGETKYSDEDVVGYELTITAMPDKKGNTHYEYIIRSEA